MALGNCLSGPSKLCGKWMLAIEICMKDAFKEEGMCVCLTQIFPWYKNQTHRIHVWYIYLHLLDFYGKCRCIYIPYMDPLGNSNQPRVCFTVLPCRFNENLKTFESSGVQD